VGSGYKTPSGLMGGVWDETPYGLMGGVWVQDYSLMKFLTNAHFIINLTLLTFSHCSI